MSSIIYLRTSIEDTKENAEKYHDVKIAIWTIFSKLYSDSYDLTIQRVKKVNRKNNNKLINPTCLNLEGISNYLTAKFNSTRYSFKKLSPMFHTKDNTDAVFMLYKNKYYIMWRNVYGSCPECDEEKLFKSDLRSCKTERDCLTVALAYYKGIMMENCLVRDSLEGLEEAVYGEYRERINLWKANQADEKDDFVKDIERFEQTMLKLREKLQKENFAAREKLKKEKRVEGTHISDENECCEVCSMLENDFIVEDNAILEPYYAKRIGYLCAVQNNSSKHKEEYQRFKGLCLKKDHIDFTKSKWDCRTCEAIMENEYELSAFNVYRY
jgi:hypothetical protein